MDFGISLDQFEAPSEQAVDDPVFAREDRLLDIAGLVRAQDILANPGGLGGQICRHS
ncbi:hypothetical protein [Sphingomonas sanxanigenens]|uniref:hypothetical protein n=1 Tax=Sphingomonas sanxanigenens TaxID=397260 RepID=UPI001B80497A|nr:hypothetical protein [Sphingomonas sanxanigenens]